jgi:hypothetical protein
VTATVDGVSTSFQVVVAAIPITPSGLMASARGTVVSLAWLDNAGDETGYEVLWRTAGGGPFALLTTLAANARSFVTNAFTADAILEYVVRACNGANCSDNSNVATVATVPATPSNPKTVDSYPFLVINWSDTNTEMFFILERDNDGVWYEQARPQAGVTQLSIDTSNDPYAWYAFYRIFACNAAGCSPPTAAFSYYDGGPSGRPGRPIGR